MPASSFLDARSEGPLLPATLAIDSNKQHHHILSLSSYTSRIRTCARTQPLTCPSPPARSRASS